MEWEITVSRCKKYISIIILNTVADKQKNNVNKKRKNKNKIQAEGLCFNHAILMTSLMDTTEGFERLYDALKEADSSDISGTTLNFAPIKHNEKMSMRKAFFSKREFVGTEKAEGRISADFVSIYPPGIPLLIPGTEIQREHIEVLKEALSLNLEITGLNSQKFIKVITE